MPSREERILSTQEDYRISGTQDEHDIEGLEGSHEESPSPESPSRKRRTKVSANGTGPLDRLNRDARNYYLARLDLQRDNGYYTVIKDVLGITDVDTDEYIEAEDLLKSWTKSWQSDMLRLF